MEALKEAEANGKTTLILDARSSLSTSSSPRIAVTEPAPSCPSSLSRPHTPYPSSGARTEGTVSVNGSLMDYIWEFIAEAHEPLGGHDTNKAGKSIRDSWRTCKT